MSWAGEGWRPCDERWSLLTELNVTLSLPLPLSLSLSLLSLPDDPGNLNSKLFLHTTRTSHQQQPELCLGALKEDGEEDGEEEEEEGDGEEEEARR